jgi:hypothetical protein
MYKHMGILERVPEQQQSNPRNFPPGTNNYNNQGLHQQQVALPRGSNTGGQFFHEAPPGRVKSLGSHKPESTTNTEVGGRPLPEALQKGGATTRMCQSLGHHYQSLHETLMPFSRCLHIHSLNSGPSSLSVGVFVIFWNFV